MVRSVLRVSLVGGSERYLTHPTDIVSGLNAPQLTCIII